MYRNIAMLSQTARVVIAGNLLRNQSLKLKSQQCIRSFHALPLKNSTSSNGHGLIVRQQLSGQHILPVVNQCRYYAKGKKEKKDKENKKDKGGKKSSKPRIEVSQEELNRIINFSKYQQQMQLQLDTLKSEYIEQLSIRSSTGALDRILVETADGKFPLIQLAQVVQKNPNLLIVNCTISPQYIGDVKKAIADSGMNLNPQQDGTTLFIPIPKVTREHREMLAKNAKTLCDKSKDKLRDIHNRYLKDLKKQKDESKDLIHNVQETLQAAFNDYTQAADTLMVTKQKDLVV